jgi:hypothetical protein
MRESAGPYSQLYFEFIGLAARNDTTLWVNRLYAVDVKFEEWAAASGATVEQRREEAQALVVAELADNQADGAIVRIVVAVGAYYSTPFCKMTRLASAVRPAAVRRPFIADDQYFQRCIQRGQLGHFVRCRRCVVLRFDVNDRYPNGVVMSDAKARVDTKQFISCRQRHSRGYLWKQAVAIRPRPVRCAFPRPGKMGHRSIAQLQFEIFQEVVPERGGAVRHCVSEWTWCWGDGRH